MPTNAELDLIVPDSNIGYRDKMNAFLVSKGTNKALTDTQASNAAAIATAIQTKSDLIQKVDDTGTYIYIGKAVPTSATSAAVWQIKRTDAVGNILFAGGVSTFTQVWDNRASLSYS